jgi:WD40 repeat protein
MDRPNPATPVEIGDRTQTIQSRDRTPPRDVATAATQEARAPAAAETLPIDDPERYSLVGEHARGGLGRVVRAVDTRLGRTVAVKELLKKSGAAEALFVREALITARLQHPGIVPVIEAGRWPSGEPYYVMKLVEGRSLKELIAERRTLEARLGLLPNVIAVAEAIGYAHSQEVIHRDVKPANVVVGEFGETVVVDWGLARDGRHAAPPELADELLPTSGATQTVSGRVIGTPQYMAPEQARGEAVDARADVYALGALLYELLAGCPPYAGRDVDSILDAVIAGPPRPIAMVVPGVAQDLLAIAAKAMARAPDDRYPTGKELAEDLKRYQTGQLVTAQRYNTVQLMRRWVRQHRGPVAVAGVAALILVAVGVGGVARIVEERNVAQRETANADTMRRKSEDRLYQLRELQAESSVRRDPTAAVAWLKQLDLDACTGDASDVLEESLAEGVARDVFREGDWVYAVAFAPDGRSLSTASKDGKVRIYDLSQSPPAVRVLGTHTGGLTMTAFTADGETLVTAGEDGEVQLWPVAGGAPRTLGSMGGMVSSLSVADGALSVRTEDDELGVWKLPSGELVGQIRKDARLTGAVASDITPGDPSRWLVGYADGHLRVVSRDAVDDLAVAAHPPRLVSFAPDGARAAVYDGAEVSVLDLAARKLVAVGAVPGHAKFLSWSPDGQQIAVGGELTDLYLFPAAGGAARVLRGHSDSIYAAHWSRDGRRILTASDDTTARVWDLVTGGVDILRGHDDDVIQAAFSPDETTVATASLDGSARVWKVGTSGVRVLGGDLDTITSVRLLDDHTALTISSPTQVVRWDLRTGARTELLPRTDDVYKTTLPASSTAGDVATAQGRTIQWVRPDGTRLDLDGHTDRVSGGGFGADGALYSAAWDGTVRRWDASGAGQVLDRGAPVEAMVMSPDGRRFLLERDGEVAVFALDGSLVRSVRRAELGGTGALEGVTFAPDGSSVVVASRDGHLSHWVLDTGAIVPLADINHHVSSVSFSPDGHTLAGAMADRTVRIWNLATGSLVTTLQGHTDLVLWVAFSPDGKLLASSSYDRTVRVWNLATHQSRVLRGHGGPVETVVWLDGARLLTGSRDGTLRIWPTPSTTAPTADQLRAALRDATTAEIGADDKLATPTR